MPSLFKRILISVLSCHGLLIFFSIFSVFSNAKPQQKKIGQKVVVQTIELNTYQPENVVAVADKIENKSETIIPTVKPVPKPKPGPKVETKPKPKPVPVVQKPAPKKNENRDKLLAKARESINKVQKTPAVTTTSAPKKIVKDVPKLIEELQSDSFSFLGETSGDYGTELINRLKLLLHLPEHGDVDVELVLAKSGKVISMKILRDENRTNRAYIEKTVPSLSFPPFEGEAQRTFAIKLTSQRA